MAQDRREPTINAIKPERDEIMRHQSRTAQPGRGAGERSAMQQRSAKRFPGSVLALFVALLACGATGFSYWQLKQTRQVLSIAEKRIEGLEEQLEMTAGDSVEKVGTINEKLEWADSEIRKLWGVSYDTNRKAIAANKEDIASLGKLAKAASDASADIKKDIASIRTLSNEQQLILTKIKEDSSLQQVDVTRALALALELDKKVKTLQDELPAKVAAHEEAIKSIDAFRRNINAEILQIKQQLGQTP